MKLAGFFFTFEHYLTQKYRSHFGFKSVTDQQERNQDASSSGSHWLLVEPKQRRQPNWIFIVSGKTLKYPEDFQYIQYTLLYRTCGSKFCRQMSELAGHSVRQANRVNHIQLEYFHETEIEG
jgi:hypothetical protein